MSIRVHVQRATEVPAAQLPDDGDIARWARTALAGRRAVGELTVRLVDEAESAHLNETYRHKSGPTNVLAFPFQAPPQVELPLLGDLAVCAPVVLREAQEQGKAAAAHWAHMIVHGTLHLLGYDHTTADQARVMEPLEIEILHGLGYPDPYGEQHVDERRST